MPTVQQEDSSPVGIDNAPKKSFFSKSTFTKTASGPDDSPEDLFRHSAQVYDGIVAEKTRRLQRQATKRERNAGRNARVVEDTPKHSRKKRRVSVEGTSADEGSHDYSGEPHAIADGRNNPTEQRLVYKTRAREHWLVDDDRSKSHAPVDHADVIDLDSDTAEEGKTSTTVTGPKDGISSSTLLDEDDDSDPDIRELIRKTKEERHQRQQISRTTSKIGNTTTVAKTSGPALSVFISTELDGAQSLIIKVNLDHKIRDVREAFCNYYEGNVKTLSRDLASHVIITWRDEPQWDFTTFGTMLKTGADIVVDPDGNLRCTSDRTDGLTSDMDKIHLEATTKAIHEAAQRLRDEQKRRSAPEPAVPEDARDAPATAESDKKDLIKVILRGPAEYAELKLKIRATDTAAKLTNAFRIAREVPGDKVMFLMFDGERLDPDTQFAQTELEPDDIIEVHVR